MPGENNDNRSEQPTALIERDALLGLLDRSAERDAPLAHTVRRDHVRSQAATREGLHMVEVSALQPRAQQEAELESQVSLSPLLVVAVIAVLIVTFIVATQLS